MCPYLNTRQNVERERERERDTIGTKRGASDKGELLASIDVLENGFVETREVLVALFQH